ncbi:MAG: UDP-N-acetylglucosamine transferase subunit ALG14 [Defluviitaleaceae bacterium]|nr:UDP-N-acetylglucosamine transferase subunit ALG14 [Defluviitaleaceae bacterium]
MKAGQVLFCASAGGHYTELLQLTPLIEKYQGVVVTEKTKLSLETALPTQYVPYSSRSEGVTYLFKFLSVCWLSFCYFLQYRPKVIISTGVHSTLPLCLLGWLFRRKVIYIETVAAVTQPTLTGKVMYKVASEFYVQWEELLVTYPNGIYGGVLF